MHPYNLRPRKNGPRDDAEGHLILHMGSKISSRYTLKSLLGQGTFGKVVKSFDTCTKSFVAIKIVKSIPKYTAAAIKELRVLQKINSCDPLDNKHCLRIFHSFDYFGHMCMTFPVLGKSLYELAEENDFKPFEMEIVKSYAHQLLTAVEFIHSIQITHTDIKPENLLVEPTDKMYLRLIDFGSSVFLDDHHSKLVSTRHYRAPEIILNCGWSFPCDLWSVGCVLVELYTGNPLFQTHENIEHLAMMEATIGLFPTPFIWNSDGRYFRKGRVDYQLEEEAKTLTELIGPVDYMSECFIDLVERLLEYDPMDRITASEALCHPFFN